MNIYNILKEKSVELTLIYYGITDLSTNYDIKCIIDNKKYIMKYYSQNFTGCIESFDNYVDFLVYRKVLALKETLEYIEKEEVKNELSEVIEVIESIKINLGSVIKYINIHIKDVMELSMEYNSMQDATMELICRFCSGITEEVFMYLINEYYYLIFNNYEKLQKVIESKEELLKVLLSEKILKNMFWGHLNKVLDIVKSLKERKYFKYKTIVDNSVEVIISFGEKINDSLTIETSFRYGDIINLIFNFLVSIKNKKAIDFEKYNKKNKELEIKYFQAYGQEFKYEIPVGEIRKMLKSDIKWELKLLSLTHIYDNKTHRMKCCLDVYEERKPSILDMVSSNMKTNDFFTRSHQEYLDVEVNVGTAAVMVIFTDKDLLSECYECYDAILKDICKKIDYADNDLYNDFRLLYQLLNNLFYSHESIGKEIENALCYGPCMFICSLVEKLLRVICKYEKQKEEYIDINNYTLGELLSKNNDVINKILGEIQVNHLRYFFLSDPDGRVGRAYRNKLAHWRDLSPDDLNRSFVCKLFYLFMNAVNSIFVYYLNE